MMRILTRAVYISAWLFTSTLCDEHVQANAEDKRGLSGILAGLAGGHLGGGGVRVTQIEVVHTATAIVAHEGVVILTLGGKNGGNYGGKYKGEYEKQYGGNKGEYGGNKGGYEGKYGDKYKGEKGKEYEGQQPTPPNYGAIWVTRSTAEHIALPTPMVGHTTTKQMGGGYAIQPSAQQPSATRISSKAIVTFPVFSTAPAKAAEPAESKSIPPILNTKPPSSKTAAASKATGSSPKESLAPGILPGPSQDGMTIGIGKIENGECVCACDCPASAFLGGQQAPIAPIVSNGTTLQTIILPPTSSVALPSNILIETSAPPNLVLPTDPAASQSSSISPDLLVSAPVTSAPSSDLSAITSTPIDASTSSTLPVIAPPQSAVVEAPSISITSAIQATTISTTATTTSADSSTVDSTSPVPVDPVPANLEPTSPTELATSDLLPTPVPDLAPDATSINIATFSLVSSLILGPLGI